jgi:hypothetical protein
MLAYVHPEGSKEMITDIQPPVTHLHMSTSPHVHMSTSSHLLFSFFPNPLHTPHFALPHKGESTGSHRHEEPPCRLITYARISALLLCHTMQSTTLHFPSHLHYSALPLTSSLLCTSPHILESLSRPLSPQVTNAFGKILTYVPEPADSLDDDDNGY